MYWGSHRKCPYYSVTATPFPEEDITLNKIFQDCFDIDDMSTKMSISDATLGEKIDLVHAGKIIQMELMLSKDCPETRIEIDVE